MSMALSRLAVWSAAITLAVAGPYQFTPLKAVCLRHCRSPVGFLLHFGGYSGRLRDVRAGVYHGGYCADRCWSLMLVLVAAGVMNMAWMAALPQWSSWKRSGATARLSATPFAAR